MPDDSPLLPASVSPATGRRARWRPHVFRNGDTETTPEDEAGATVTVTGADSPLYPDFAEADCGRAHYLQLYGVFVPREHARAFPESRFCPRGSPEPILRNHDG